MDGAGALQPVDAVEVTVLVDNVVDILLAEHGLSLLLAVEREGRREERHAPVGPELRAAHRADPRRARRHRPGQTSVGTRLRFDAAAL